ncbi:MAG: DUF3098 domain-containing protein [Chlorobiaceae bacterium]|nr:DUF3098 domain-containing protein [Chlorobiaceae bacterium]
MKSSPKKQEKKKAEKAEKKAAMPLGKINYLMLLLGAVVIAVSYGLMYIEKNVDGVFALFVSPFTLLGSYAWIIFALLYRPAAQGKDPGQSS